MSFLFFSVFKLSKVFSAINDYRDNCSRRASQTAAELAFRFAELGPLLVAVNAVPN